MTTTDNFNYWLADKQILSNFTSTLITVCVSVLYRESIYLLD